MKKCNLIKSLTTILLLGGGLFALTCLSSCENFLTGDEIIKNIEDSITYANADECTLIIKSDPAYGSFLSEGEKKCKVGYTINLQYTVTTKDYFFVGLEAVSSSDNSINRSDYVEIIINNPDEAAISGVYKITIKLLKKINDILITPKFEKLENADIKIDGEHGDFNPEKGTYNLIIGRSFNLYFDPSEDWEFIYWKIYDEVSGNEIQDGTYLTFKNRTQKNTSFVFKGLPESSNLKLVITPVVAERPQVISYSPMNYGHFKDSTIQVLFDRDMDEQSIYFTDPEIDALQKAGVSEFLPSLSSGRGKQYGYVKEGKTYFKNIVLTNNKTGKNINDRFAAPFFDNPRTLSIPASKETGHMLDSYTQVLVSIEKEFFYSEAFGDPKPKPVTLSQSKKWMYQVNGLTDTKPLIVATSGGNDEFTAELTDDTKLAGEATHTIAANGSGIETLKFMKDGKFNLNLRVLDQDNGSGPSSSFKLHLKKLYGENYKTLAANEQIEKTATINYQNVTADEAVFNDTIIFRDEFKEEEFTLDDGLYSIYFEFRDRSNNVSYYPIIPKGPDNSEEIQKYYYFAVDTKSPVMGDPVIRSSNSTTYTLEWNDYCDLKTTEIIYTEDGTEKPVVSIEKGTRNSDITNITAGKTYDVKVKFTDYAGNYVEKTIPKFLTGFTLTGTPSFTGTNASHADKIFFVGDPISYYGITARKYYSDGSEYNITSNYTIPGRNAYNSIWPFTYTYTEGYISKSPEISGTYYVAQKGALTQKPVYSHKEDSKWEIYKFGDYPQSVSTISSYTSDTVYNGWYLGSDGYFYEKCHTNISGKSSTTAGGSLQNNTDYYFKVQPLEWRLASSNFSGRKLLIAKKNLDCVQYYTSTSDRTINGSSVKANNYKYSTLRAFLNGKYESGDTQTKSYLNKGFLQKAFTVNAQALIYEGSVKNDEVSTNPKNNPNEWGGGTNVNTCGTTEDKVFVLSVQDVTNTSYGFDSLYNWQKFGLRLIHTTDYAKAKHVYENPSGNNTGTSDTYASEYWTRSPSRTEGEKGKARCVDSAAIISDTDVTNPQIGVVPAIVLSN